MINILFLAIEFPPLATAGVHRSIKFVKYLHKHAINPIVITLSENSAKEIFGNKIDYKLLNEIPSDIEIIRIECPSIKKYYSSRLRSFVTIYFSIKDIIALTWKKSVFAHLDGIIDETSPKLIYSTLPPFSAGSLGVQISKKYKLPLITDMRDGWSAWRTVPYGSYLHYFLTKKEENYVFKNSKLVIGSTKELVNIFRIDHPKLGKNKFKIIPNGFDSELEPSVFTIPPFAKSKKHIIGYVGAFYYTPEGRLDMFKPWWKKNGHRLLQYVPVKEDWLYRSPFFFFKILEKVLSINPILNDFIELHFVGIKPNWMDKMLSEFNLPIRIKFHGQKPYDECKQIIRSFDSVLITSAKRIGGLDWALPSKIFDYISSNKAIIGVTPQGATSRFIESTNTGIVIDPDNENESVQKLNCLFMEGLALEINVKELYLYTRFNTAALLAKSIKSILETKSDFQDV
jgi:hypothetical protein